MPEPTRPGSDGIEAETLDLQRAQTLAELLVETLGDDASRLLIARAIAPHGGDRVNTSVRGAVDRVLEALLTVARRDSLIGA